MLDFDKYVLRHGEPWVQRIVEEMEFCEGIRVNIDAPLELEDRWNALMPAAAQPNAMAA